MRIALALGAIFFARMLVSAWFYQGQDADLSWQNWLGTRVLAEHHIPTRLGAETFTANGAHWVAQEWAFSTAVAWSNEHHWFSWLAVLTALAAFGAIALTAYRAKRRGSSTLAIVLATVCTGFSMLEAFGVRAQVYGWLCLALLMLVLDTESVWIYLAIPIVALWANLHASAMIAPVLVGAWSIGTWIEDRAWTPRVARNVLTAFGCVAAVFMTPLLGELPRYALSLQTSPIRSAIVEWQPSDLNDLALYAGVLPLIAICVYFGIAAPRERWRDGALFAISVPMAFMAVRHLPICALVIAPMAAQRLTSLLGASSRVNVVLKERFPQVLIIGTSSLFATILAVHLLHTPKVAGINLPVRAIARLAGISGMHNLYCEDFAWCSLALEQPNLRTFVDGRCDPFPKRVWQDYIAVEHLYPRWNGVLSKYGVDAVLTKDDGALSQGLRLRPDWRAIYNRQGYELFVRRGIRTART